MLNAGFAQSSKVWIFLGGPMERPWILLKSKNIEVLILDCGAVKLLFGFMKSEKKTDYLYEHWPVLFVL